MTRWLEISRGPIDPNLLANVTVFAILFLVLLVASAVFVAAWHDNSPAKCIYVGASFPAFISSIAAIAPSLPGR